jgi:hypothetical protein
MLKIKWQGTGVGLASRARLDIQKKLCGVEGRWLSDGCSFFVPMIFPNGHPPLRPALRIQGDEMRSNTTSMVTIEKAAQAGLRPGSGQAAAKFCVFSRRSSRKI